MVTHGKVETTLSRAKDLRIIAEKLITLGKKATLQARQQSRAILGSEYLTQKLFSDLALRYQSKSGGYTRVLVTRLRKGDSATLAMVQYL